MATSVGSRQNDNDLKQRNQKEENDQGGKDTPDNQNEAKNNGGDHNHGVNKNDIHTLTRIWQYYFYYYYYYNHYMALLHYNNYYKNNQINRNQPNSNQSPSTTNTNSSTHIRRTTRLLNRQQGVKPASLAKRVFAEMIDFLIIFTVKTMILSYHGIEAKFSQAQLRVLIEDRYNAEDLQLIIVYAIFYRIFVFIIETICLYKGVGNGMTIGKLIVGIQVIACDAIIDDGNTGNNHGYVQVFPGDSLNWQRSIMRSVIKNFSTMFFFPVILTIMLFKHGRTAYDIISGTIVIERQINRLPGRN
ncbi:Protein FAM8A1 [Trichoplax sp. H2]|uniref:RDD domain-containing protein n=1 Tax=Trichoplax adhaerens TaxID=10228 RepID=B3S215_TRIAD|nr:hypothetical protein TRIADDRAFT_58414 [Trichoplax adhaerens]EDV23602.1 hypothetical protein TRIADDRAFT_58414 [Trichoplax adhaerens]RDD37589.1 Protein FAM8A1 [Trichoplax sp. H2]|eukprot:XP_002114512.1 hypothetical protein TRIADDRAFT_58414 [Trichoplax adhaerens]